MSQEQKVIDDLNTALEQAHDAGSYFVTVSWKPDKNSKEIKHVHGWVKFSSDDVIPCLDHIKEIISQENPTVNNITNLPTLRKFN